MTDNTGAFQRAIDSLNGPGVSPVGGVVWVPSGLYSFTGSVALGHAVTLAGTFTSVPAHPIGERGEPPTDGSVLMPRGGRGNESGTPFITVGDDSTVVRGAECRASHRDLAIAAR